MTDLDVRINLVTPEVAEVWLQVGGKRLEVSLDIEGHYTVYTREKVGPATWKHLPITTGNILEEN